MLKRQAEIALAEWLVSHYHLILKILCAIKRAVSHRYYISVTHFPKEKEQNTQAMEFEAPHAG